MLICNERSCQAHCVGGWRSVSVAGSDRGRDLNVAQQIIVLRRTAPKKQSFGAIDRLVFVRLYRLFPRVLDALAIVRPATVIKWHRAGFRLYWRWKSRPRRGRPPVPLEIRRLIREMSIANPLWGAPRIHGELLKLGIAIGQTSVAKYMAKRRGPPSQGWKTFLRNHADGIATIDLFVVPTISFRLLYGLLIMGHGRRQVIWFGVTTHPTANGSQTSSRKPADGAASPLSDPRSRWSVWGSFHPTTSIKWAFAISRRLRGLHGKTGMPNG